MITKAVFNNKLFRLIDNFQFEFTNNEVSFQDIIIDFTGMSLEDMPFKYQEIKVYQFKSENDEGELIFSGFVDEVNISDMLNEDEDRELIITLLSPMKMATVRNVTLIGTFEKEEAVRRVLQPLLDDGFSIKEINVSNGQITCNYLIQTIEFCLNDISSRLGLFWTINEKKEITVVGIDSLFNKLPAKTITGNIRNNELIELSPSIKNIDYANVINIKKARVYYETETSIIEWSGAVKSKAYPIMNLPKKLMNGEEVQFENPIVIDKELLKKIALQDIHVHGMSNVDIYDNFKIVINCGNNNYFNAEIGIYYSQGEFGNQDSNNFSYSDSNEEAKKIILIRDNFFKNLIVGFKWNGEDNATIQSINSCTALRYNNIRVLNNNEINQMKGIISETGIIEKTIDYNEQWSTEDDLIEYARSQMTQNTNTINQVILKYDKNPNIQLGDIVEIDEKAFFTKGRFVVSEILFEYINENDINWTITLKNADLLSTFIDLFRPSVSQEQNIDSDTSTIAEYSEGNIYEKHELEEVEEL